MDFQLVSDFKPTGDQPKAIQEIVSQFKDGDPYITLQGVTGSSCIYPHAIKRCVT